MTNSKVIKLMPLGDLVEKIVGGGTPSRKKPEYYGGSIPWVTVKDLNGIYLNKTQEYITEEGLKNSSANLIEKGNIIIATRMALGKAFINTVDMAINQDLKALYPKSFVDTNYLLYSILNKSKEIERQGTGTTVKGIRLEVLREIPIHIPSLKEQQKIAAILSTVNETIEKTQQIIEQTETVKKGLMQDLFTNGIGHTQFKKTKVGKVPLEWDVIDFANVADSNEKYSFVGGPFGSDLTAKEYTDKGVRIIQLQNIGDGKFFDDYKIYTSNKKADQLYKCNIFPGDIIIAKMAEPVARACIVPDFSDRFLMASDGIRVKVDEAKYDKRFILHAINSPYFRKQAIINSTGTTRLRIGLNALRNLKMAIPPYSEQLKISSIIDNIDKKINIEEKKLKKLQTTKWGLMQQLLTGKVRVKVDASEEVMS